MGGVADSSLSEKRDMHLIEEVEGKQGAVALVASGDQVPSLTRGGGDDESHNVTTNEDELIKLQVEKLFNLYTSVKRGSSLRILRKSDLIRFIEDVNAVQWLHRRNRIVERFELIAENLFDEVLELQVDMGSGIRYGIVLEFFHVFIGRAAARLSWSQVSFLMAVLERFQ